MSERPIGYFVHHQGRGHAERALDLIQALPPHRPVTVFCARPELLAGSRAEVVAIPSLFEARGDETVMDHVATPATLHCAPLGWPGIRAAMGRMAAWFATADPAVMVVDVSAEVAQLARLCSVPHVKVVQHGDRGDPGHRAAYDGAAGLLAPFDAALAQPEWDGAMRAKMHFAGGLGVATGGPDRATARRRLGVPDAARMVLAMSGAGGAGMAAAPLGVGARGEPGALWITIGEVARDWHATEPANLRHDGWVTNAADYLAAADVVVASCGNTACHQILAAGKPWIVVPEWRYFDEQVRKAQALARAGAAYHVPHLPSSAQAWTAALIAAERRHDPARQRRLVRQTAAADAARWLERLAHGLWPAPLAVAAE